MNKQSYDNHIHILKAELVNALGCTEPIAIAYCAAVTRRALGTMPDCIEIHCSGNMIKNVKSVTVPNSQGMKGIEAAATLGMVGGNAQRGLEVLEGVDDEAIETAKRLVKEGFCQVDLVENVPNLYVACYAFAKDETASCVISERHTNIVELTHNDESLLEPEAHHDDCAAIQPNCQDCDRSALSLSSIWEFIHEVDVDDIRDVILNQLANNEAISKEGLSGNWGACVGRTLLDSRPDDISTCARAAAAAGSDARMSGCPLPVTIVCGSGNQGITCSMPVLEYARYLEADADTLIRAVALSNLVAVHVKHYIGELSAFCGAVSAAAGAGSAICYLKGGDFQQFQNTIINTLGNVGGIVCDGAKPSCAAKISSSLDAAILGCDMALAGRCFLAGEGLMGADPEDTIRNMGYVGRVGMHPTDVEILNLMIGKTKVD